MFGRSVVFPVLLLAVLLLLLWDAEAQADEKKVVMCSYFRYEIYDKKKVSKLRYHPDVNYPCTHLVYGQNLWIFYNQISLERRFPRYDREMTRKIKARHPGLKILLSAKLKGAKYWPEENWRFAANVIRVLRGYGFDGLEIDSGHLAYKPEKDPFSQMVMKVYRGFEAEARRNGNPRLILTVTVLPQAKYIKYYIPTELNSFTDYVVVNAIRDDSRAKLVDNLSPVYASKLSDQVPLVNLWLSQGLQPTKLVLPFTTYLVDVYYCEYTTHKPPDCRQVYSHKLHITKFKVPYVALCKERTKAPDIPARWKVIYDIKPFETPASVKTRMGYILKNNLAGTKVYPLMYDDYMGRCGKGRFQLTRTAYQELLGPLQTRHALPSSRSGSSALNISVCVVILVICIHLMSYNGKRWI